MKKSDIYRSLNCIGTCVQHAQMYLEAPAGGTVSPEAAAELLRDALGTIRELGTELRRDLLTSGALSEGGE